MIKPTVGLQDLRKKMYQKGKTEKSWRFWGLYVHICKEETLQESYRMARKNKGAPGIDGVTFEAIDGAVVPVGAGWGLAPGRTVRRRSRRHPGRCQ